MTSNNNTGSGASKVMNLVESLDDFLLNMDREREAINARILAAYGEGAGGAQRLEERVHDFRHGSHDTSYNHDNSANDNDEDGSTSSASMLVSVRGDGNIDGARDAQNNEEEGGGAPPSHRDVANSSLEMIRESKVDTANNNNNSSSSEDTSNSEVDNLTQQSQRLYDKLNTSYTSHATKNNNDDLEEISSTRGGLIATIPTMTTYNSSPGGSSCYLGTPSSLVVRKIVEERGGGEERRQLQKEEEEEEQCGTIRKEEDSCHDVHEAGSKESYDWVLQQLSKKKEVSDNTKISKRAIVESTFVSERDVATSSKQSKATGWFQNNNNRVSVVLRVNSNQNAIKAASSGGGEDNILFPIPFENDHNDKNAGNSESVAEGLHRGKVVLINPNIFNSSESNNNNSGGPMSLKNRLRGGGDTVEIARLVAQVSQISSTEDWARQYQFDDVIGMVGSDGTAITDDKHDDGVDSLTLLAHRVVEGSSGGSIVLFASGGTKSGKTRMVFGSFISDAIASVTTARMEDVPSNLGMVGDIIQQVLRSNSQCSISILEIADDDVLRDILGFSDGGLNEQRGMSVLRLRHGDRKRGRGAATVENLWQVPITSCEEACEIISDAFQSRSLRKIWSEEGHGHFVVTISFSAGSGDNEPCIQVVDLASPDCKGVSSSSSSRVSSIRKSLSALRGVLRGLDSYHSNSSSALPVSFRDCTLTKVLQRSLEGNDTKPSRAVVIGCVNPSSTDYSQTLRTMDFLTGISAQTGETSKSPFQDGSNRPSPASTPQQRRSDGALLKSIVSDPRQRLAKLLTPQSNSKDGRGSHEKNRVLSTPRSGSTYSDTMAQQRYRDTYTSVFDQLENLMSNEDEEDNIDRDSYGNTIIQAITPNPKSNTKKLPEPSPDMTEDMFSPLQNALTSEDRNHGMKWGLSGEMEMEGSSVLQNKKGVEVAKQHHQSTKDVTRDAAESDDGPPLFSEIEFERRTWNEFSPESSSHGRMNQNVFVEKSKLVPLKTLISQDSMDSELLVSCRSNANAKLSSATDTIDHPKLLPTNYETNEVAAADLNVSTMVESFQRDVEALIKKSPSPKYRSKDTGSFSGRRNLDSLHETDGEEDYYSNRNSNVRAEVAALKSMLDRLKKEKAATDSFLHKLQMTMDDNESYSFGDDTSYPSKCLSLINTVRERQAMMASLQRELEDCKAKNLAIAVELEQAGTDRSFEKDLERAKELISDQTKKVKLEKARIKELSSENSVFVSQLGEIDRKLDIGAPSSKQGMCDASRQQSRLERVERMQAGLQQLFAKNEELERLLAESQVEGSKARKAADLLEAKVNDMQSQANQSQGANSRAVEAAEKLAEEAVRDNEALTNEIAQLRDNITRTREEYLSLREQHQLVVAKNADLSAERERILDGKQSEVMAVRDALNACKKEKAQLEEQLASFSSRTAEMMKRRIDDMKADYKRQLSSQQARIKQLEEQKDAHQVAALTVAKTELSEKQSENENLRMRIVQIEEETALKIQDREAVLAQIQTELDRATDEAKFQRDENTTLQNELNNLRGIIDVAEQSVNEVNRLRIENDQLQESIRSQRDQTHDTSFEVPFEVRGKDSANNVSFLHDADEYFMKERIAALMRENEQNNISMRSLQNENVALKSSVDQCTGTIDLMRSELNDLKSMTSEGMSKMRMRHEKDKITIAEMEKKLESANALIRKIRPTHGGMRSMADETSSTSRWNTPLDTKLPRRFETSFTPYDASEKKSNAAELSAEKELRYKAEEICASVLADAKLGFEERDKEIERLRSKLARTRGYYL